MNPFVPDTVTRISIVPSASSSGRWLFVLAVVAAAHLPPGPVPAEEWNNPGTGGGAGNWFDSSNWNPAIVPSPLSLASINNGGEARVDGGTAPGPVEAALIDVGKNGGSGLLTIDAVSLAVGASLDIGDVQGTFATGPMTVTSLGAVTIQNADSLRFGTVGPGDLNVGQTSAENGATAEGTATLDIDTVATLQVSADLDVGQSSGSGFARGNGTAMIRDVTNLLSVGGDIDVGQTSAALGGDNQGHGMLTISRATQVDVGADVDVGQSTGDGRSSASGTLNVGEVSVFNIGDSLDIAKIRAFNNAANTGVGMASFTKSTLNVGFGDPLGPGSVEIARTLVSESALGDATGHLLLDEVELNVANNIIIGELAFGGTNADNRTDAQLTMINSFAVTRDLNIAQVLDGTSGSATGTLRLTRSLADVRDLLTMSAGATLHVDLAGTTRADGNGGADHYGTINADTAFLAGTLELETVGTFTDPQVPGQSDSFTVLQTVLGYNGVFDEIVFNGTSLVPAFAVGPAGDFTAHVGEGLFREVDYTPNSVEVTSLRALPGDANGDRVVDTSDFNIWNSNKFSSGDWLQGDFNGDGFVDASDFNLWNGNKFTSYDVASGPTSTVPEPAAWPLLVLGTMAGFLRLRRCTIPLH